MEPQPKTRTLTTEATEEHGGNQKSKTAGSNDLKIFAAREEFQNSNTERPSRNQNLNTDDTDWTDQH